MGSDQSELPPRGRSSVRVFGGAGVWHEGEPVSVGGPRQRRLLALLAIRAGATADIDWLAENLWTDDDRPEASDRALRTYVSRLRAALPDDAEFAVETAPGGYRLHAPAEAVEHQWFSELRTSARQARERQDPVAAQDLLDEALGLWRGNPFPELEDLDWARAEIERLRQDRLETVEERFEVSLALGRHTQIIGELAAFTHEHGLRERAWRQYAVALHRAGRTAEALRVVRHYREQLAETSGLDPSPEMNTLERQLLDGDSALDGHDEGRALRGYRLLEQIGSGAFSLVWRAIQPSVDREVAVKQIRAELATQPAFIRRFEAEAQLVARIEHPHVVPLIDYWRDPDSAYLVMRWLRGGTLEDRLDDGPWSLDNTLAMTAQIGDALAAAHAHGVIHRDVKPANILFDNRDNAYLSDFGIALDAIDTTGPAAALSHGSPAYAAPEQLRKEELGPAADVFSLAVVVFECLAGSIPFTDVTEADELVRRQIDEPFPPLASLRPDLPASVGDAVARATSKQPAERFDTVEAFVDALELRPRPEPPRPALGGATVITGPLANPYLGLRAFSEADTEHFHGRSRLVAEVIDRLDSGGDVTSRCVVLVGPSGSGKSSVARAGVIPAIRAGRVTNSESWFTTTMVPGSDPYEALETALLRVAVNPPPALVGQLRDGPRGILRSVRRTVANDGDRIVVVIDQLEELFTHTDADTTAAFLNALSVAVEDPNTPLRLVATLRADFYDQPLRHLAFARILKATAVDVTPLAPDELEEAITMPAAKVGVGFEGPLVTRIAAEALGQPAPLPLLQHALAELFDRRVGTTITEDLYREIGGMTGALASRAENIYSACTPAEKAAARRLFGRLADPTPGRGDLRRRALLADLGDSADTATVIDRYTAARLLTRDHDPSTREPTIEVAHEALLREWPRLREWLTEDRAVLTQLDSVQAATDRWLETNRQDADLLRGVRLDAANELASTAGDRLRPVDHELVTASTSAAHAHTAAETRRHRRLRRLTTATSIALVVAVVAASTAFVQRNRADEAADEARVEAARADEQTSVARDEAERAEAALAASEQLTLVSRAEALATESPDAALLLAVEAYRRERSIASQEALLVTLRAWDGVVQRTDLPEVQRTRCDDSAWDADGYDWPTDGGLAVYAQGDDVFTVDPMTGEASLHTQRPDPCARILISHANGPLLAQTATGISMVPVGGGPDDVIPLIETTAAVSLASSPPPEPVVGVVTNPGVDTGELHLFDATGRPIASPVPTELGFRDLWWGSSGTVVLGTGATPARRAPGRVELIDVASGAIRWGAPTDSLPLEATFSPSERSVAVTTATGEVVVLATEDGRAQVLQPANGAAEGLAFVDDDRLAVATSSGVEVWNLVADKLEDEFAVANAGNVHALDDDQLVVYSQGYDTATVLDVASASGIATARLPTRQGERPTLYSTVDRVGLVGANGAAVVDLASGARVDHSRSLPADEIIVSLIPSDTIDEFWTVSVDGTVRRHAEDDVVDTMEMTAGEGTRIAAGRGTDGRVAFGWVGTDDGAATYLVDLEAMEIVNGPTAPPSTACACAVFIAPDLESLVIEDTGVLRVYAPDGTVTSEVRVSGTQSAFGVVPDAGPLFRGTQGGSVESIDLSGDSEPVPLDDFQVAIDALKPIGADRLAILLQDGAVWLLDLASGERIGRLWDGAGSGIGVSPTLSSDGSRLRIANSAEVVELALDPDVWAERACDLAGRDLTRDEWEELVPGDAPYRSTCSQWPGAAGGEPS